MPPTRVPLLYEAFIVKEKKIIIYFFARRGRGCKNVQSIISVYPCKGWYPKVRVCNMCKKHTNVKQGCASPMKVIKCEFLQSLLGTCRMLYILKESLRDCKNSYSIIAVYPLIHCNRTDVFVCARNTRMASKVAHPQ
jgi:hypothetical protein